MSYLICVRSIFLLNLYFDVDDDGNVMRIMCRPGNGGVKMLIRKEDFKVEQLNVLFKIVLRVIC